MNGIEKVAVNSVKHESAKPKKDKLDKTSQLTTTPLKNLDGLDALASQNRPLVKSAKVAKENVQTANIRQETTKLPEGVPEYIYHLTSKKLYEKILDSGSMHGSTWEGELAESVGSQSNMPGIYMVSKDNFCNKWMGAHFEGDFDVGDIGELLLQFTSKGDKDMVAIQIPTRSLDLSKLRFRPYIEASMDAIENFENGGSKLGREGLPLSELPNYIDKGPVEFVYQDNIPSSLLKTAYHFKYDLESPFTNAESIWQNKNKIEQE